MIHKWDKLAVFSLEKWLVYRWVYRSWYRHYCHWGPHGPMAGASANLMPAVRFRSWGQLIDGWEAMVSPNFK